MDERRNFREKDGTNGKELWKVIETGGFTVTVNKSVEV